MQNPYTTQTELFISTSRLDHPISHSFDGTEALLELGSIENLSLSVYSSKTGPDIHYYIFVANNFLSHAKVVESGGVSI